MTEEALPVAVWSGEICGVKVHVLDNGQRIIDRDDVFRLFGLIDDAAEGRGDFDADAFAVEFTEWAKGTGVPPPDPACGIAAGLHIDDECCTHRAGHDGSCSHGIMRDA